MSATTRRRSRNAAASVLFVVLAGAASLVLLGSAGSATAGDCQYGPYGPYGPYSPYGPCDETPPVIVAPASVVADATGPAGASVTFTVTATDDTDTSPTVACVPQSGSLFPIGDTTVGCTATDDADNQSIASFVVHVRGSGDQLTMLEDEVRSLESGRGLAGIVDAAQAALARGSARAACEQLRAFGNAVQAQSGKRIPTVTATELLADAQRISAVIRC